MEAATNAPQRGPQQPDRRQSPRPGRVGVVRLEDRRPSPPRRGLHPAHRGRGVTAGVVPPPPRPVRAERVDRGRVESRAGGQNSYATSSRSDRT